MSELSLDIPIDEPAETPGYDPTKRNYGESGIEFRVRRAIEQQNETDPLTPSQWALAETCLALAENIAAGNKKGRAIANEASQLDALMSKLAGEEDTADEDALPPETRQLLEALSTPPRLDTPSASYAAQL